ncbi:hypothetical protein Scep_003060 [Stephania cephalantha]|uniref:Glutathione peroxidase n=1 Tax=Stephania cephalantha TaxID=152367 RepID=A0AAP0KPT5_9MAGN
MRGIPKSCSPSLAVCFSFVDAKGTDVDLSTYKGKALLIVNVASQWYDEIFSLVLGLEILAFPCNRFGGREPGTNERIVEFACTRFKVSIPYLTSRSHGVEVAVTWRPHVRITPFEKALSRTRRATSPPPHQMDSPIFPPPPPLRHVRDVPADVASWLRVVLAALSPRHCRPASRIMRGDNPHNP